MFGFGVAAVDVADVKSVPQARHAHRIMAALVFMVPGFYGRKIAAGRFFGVIFMTSLRQCHKLHPMVIEIHPLHGLQRRVS